MTFRASRWASLIGGMLLVGCGASDGPDSRVSNSDGATTDGATVPATAPLAVVTRVTEPTTIVPSAGKKPVSDVAMEAGVVYSVPHVASANADLVFTAPSPTSFPYAVQFMFAMTKDAAGNEGLINVFFLNKNSRFLKDPGEDVSQLTNQPEFLAATDPIGDDLFAQFENVAGLTTTRVPGTQKLGGLDAEVLVYRVDSTLPSQGSCPGTPCLVTLWVPGAALGMPAGETGRLGLVTVGGSTLLVTIVDDPMSEQILSTMTLVAA
jgi:hypothetical protein